MDYVLIVALVEWTGVTVSSYGTLETLTWLGSCNDTNSDRGRKGQNDGVMLADPKVPEVPVIVFEDESVSL